MGMIQSISRPHPPADASIELRPSRASKPPPITQEQLRELLHYDPETGVFTRKVATSNSVKVGDVAGSPSSNEYINIRVHGRLQKAHRLAWLYVHGTWPTEDIDHVNRDRTDNRLLNLREATRQENMHNTSKLSSNKSGHPGVHWDIKANKWCAQIGHNRRSTYLGQFADIEDAVAARKAGELKYWGANRAD